MQEWYSLSSIVTFMHRHSSLVIIQEIGKWHTSIKINIYNLLPIYNVTKNQQIHIKFQLLNIFDLHKKKDTVMSKKEKIAIALKSSSLTFPKLQLIRLNVYEWNKG